MSAQTDSQTCSQTYTITELAREFDITARAIRFYEDQGLLTPAREGRNRVYSKADRTRLKLTLRGKRLGLSLAEIRELLHMYGDVRDSGSQLQRFLRILATRRAEMEQQQRDIAAVLREIDMLEQQCHALLGENEEGAAAARAELQRHINQADLV
ncbi:MAG: MerR family DNA-binding transcriptional regulator [Thauera sp.]|nr:MerR family DNA-binding transcriptional regulator [Thauera sp.]